MSEPKRYGTWTVLNDPRLEELKVRVLRVLTTSTGNAHEVYWEYDPLYPEPIDPKAHWRARRKRMACIDRTRHMISTDEDPVGHVLTYESLRNIKDI